VRAKAFNKPRSLSHGACDSNVGTKSSVGVDASCSISQGTSHLHENGDSSTQTMPLDRPLYHYSVCGKDGHQGSFCYHARKMCRACAFRPLVVHGPFCGMNTCEPKKAHFVDGFYDTLSSELDHARGHVSSASSVGPRYASSGACVRSSPMTTRDLCLFAYGNTRFSSWVAPLRHDSKSVRNPFHSNRHWHHANSHDKLSASHTHVTKYWIPKYVLANPLGSNTRSFSSPCV
jgi:hypothetical protein